jgi:single-stranded DNA-binding protein
MYGLATGTIFRDIEVRESKAGKTFAKATIKSGSGDDTIFVRVIVFDGPQLDTLRNLQSGDSISVQGRIKLSTNEKAGEWKAAVDLLADQVMPLRKSETGAKAPERRREAQDDPAPRARAHSRTADIIDDEIPF